MQPVAHSLPSQPKPPLVFETVSHSFEARRGKSLWGGKKADSKVSALRGFDLTLEQGQIVCLLGPSGSGKSTALRLAAGLERVQDGQIFSRGGLVSARGVHRPPELRDMGMVFQDFALFPHMSAWQNVAYGLKGMELDQRKRLAHEWLERVGLEGKAERLPHELSGGQQQRVGLARALAPQPSVLLLDEPYSGLDQSLRERLRDDTMHFIQSIGASAMMVTHDPDEAMYMASRIAVIRDGKLLQNDRPDEVLFRPKDPFVVAIFGEPNRVEGVVKDGSVDTALGRFKAEQFDDNTPVEVLIPPHGIKPCPVGAVSAVDQLGKAQSFANGLQDRALPVGQVMESRVLGRNSLVHLSLDHGVERPLHIHAKVDGIFLPQTGTEMGLGVVQDLVFIFKRRNAKI